VTILVQHLPRLRRPQAARLIAEARDRQRRRRRRILLAALVLGLGGGLAYGMQQRAAGSGVRTPQALPNPCALLTNAQAGAALQDAIRFRVAGDALRPTPAALYRSCTWHGAPLTSFGYSNESVEITITRTTRARFLKGERLAGARPLRGLGAAAYAVEGPARFVEVYSRGRALMITATAVDPIRAEVAIAKLALARLR